MKHNNKNNNNDHYIFKNHEAVPHKIRKFMFATAFFCVFSILIRFDEVLLW